MRSHSWMHIHNLLICSLSYNACAAEGAVNDEEKGGQLLQS